MIEVTALQRTFEECALARARLQTSIISKTGNIDTQFFSFHSHFAALYNLSLPNDELRAIPGDGSTLIEQVSDWLTHAKNKKDADRGGVLFERFTWALTSVGLL
jgi:hypothetical protein